MFCCSVCGKRFLRNIRTAVRGPFQHYNKEECVLCVEKNDEEKKKCHSLRRPRVMTEESLLSFFSPLIPLFVHFLFFFCSSHTTADTIFLYEF